MQTLFSESDIKLLSCWLSRWKQQVKCKQCHAWMGSYQTSGNQWKLNTFYHLSNPPTMERKMHRSPSCKMHEICYVYYLKSCCGWCDPKHNQAPLDFRKTAFCLYVDCVQYSIYWRRFTSFKNPDQTKKMNGIFFAEIVGLVKTTVKSFRLFTSVYTLQMLW